MASLGDVAQIIMAKKMVEGSLNDAVLDWNSHSCLHMNKYVFTTFTTFPTPTLKHRNIFFMIDKNNLYNFFFRDFTFIDFTF